MSDELVYVKKSQLTDLGDAVRERFDVSGTKTLEELTEIVDPNVPDDYDVLEYIQSSGTQYVETDVIPDKYTCVRIKFRVPSLPTGSNEWGLFGTDVSGNQAQSFMATITSSKVICRQYYAVPNTKYDYFEPSANRIDTLAFGGGNMCFSSGNYVMVLTHSQGGNTEIDYYNNAANLKLYLFALNSSNSPLLLGSFQLLGCDMFNNVTGEALGDFVPVKRKSDNEVGVYNKVTKVFCPNKGTDPFIIPT